MITACLTYLGFYVLMLIGYVNQLIVRPNIESEKNRDVSPSMNRCCRFFICDFNSFSQGYVPLFNSFERFYLAYVYRRIRDCWNRPICSLPGAFLTLKDRITKDYGWTFE